LRLYPDAFLDTLLPIPPLDEQLHIVATVRQRIKREDKLLSLNAKATDLLREKRAALITAAVTGQLNISNNKTSADNVIPFTTRIAAQIIYHHRNTQRFGRVKFQKALYLAEAHAGISELQGKYERRAAGPLDQQLLNRLEAGLQDAELYAAQSADSGEQIEYTLLSGAGDQRGALKSELGARADSFYHILDKLTDLSTKSAEAVATLYAVWNDALIDGETPDDARIIHGVLEEWHPEKKEKFRKDELETWLGWMRRNGFTPKGTGPRTTLGRLLV
jgi:type I restriction enzyme S subunit